jgi:hypothetical protein
MVRSPIIAMALGMSVVASALAAGPAAAGSVTGSGVAASKIAPPVSQGTLRIAGRLQDGRTIAARGLTWRPGRLPAGDRLISFEVGYTWQACASGQCLPGADSTVTPFAARRYVVGHADTGQQIEVVSTATEVVQTHAVPFSFKALRATASYVTSGMVRAYQPGRPPVSEFVDGLPERTTGSNEEYFHVDPAHYSSSDGPVTQKFRIDSGAWLAMPEKEIFFTGKLPVGHHRVSVLTSDSAGRSAISFRWRVVPLAAPLSCQGSCWYPPHLGANGKPMRWDWQIGLTTPLQRTGKRAVDIYDIDGFLTTKAEVHAIHTSWQASTLAHPKAVCYLDLAWEDYRPDASPAAGRPRAPGALFPASSLGKIYFGYPQERWVDFRQLNLLKPMLIERISMCARKGFDAVELDDIDSFAPASTTGFELTAGDAKNYLAYAFNLVHSYGMTVLWKNAPELATWGVRYTDGAVVEECYVYHQCASWRVFSTDKTAAQPNGKWVGEAEYGADHYVCNPGQTGKRCTGRRSFAAFCRSVYSPSYGFSAVKFDVDLDGRVFFPCPAGI